MTNRFWSKSSKLTFSHKTKSCGCNSWWLAVSSPLWSPPTRSMAPPSTRVCSGSVAPGAGLCMWLDWKPLGAFAKFEYLRLCEARMNTYNGRTWINWTGFPLLHIFQGFFPFGSLVGKQFKNDSAAESFCVWTNLQENHSAAEPLTMQSKKDGFKPDSAKKPF